MISYDIGDVVRVTATFTVAGVATNPAAVTFRIKPPAGAPTAISGTQTATGTYTTDINATLPGIWYYRVEGTGAAQAAAEGSFHVQPSAFDLG